eukprot:563086-Amphidinium_carterae.2
MPVSIGKVTAFMECKTRTGRTYCRMFASSAKVTTHPCSGGTVSRPFGNSELSCTLHPFSHPLC